MAASNTLPVIPGSARDFEAQSVSRAALVVALVASMLVHAGMFLAARRAPDHGQAGPQSSELPAAAPTSIEWAGTTSEVPGGEKLYDVSLAGSSAADVDPSGPKLPAPKAAPSLAPAPAPAPAKVVELKAPAFVDRPKVEKGASSERAPKNAKTSVDPYEELDAKPAASSSSSSAPAASASPPAPATSASPPPSAPSSAGTGASAAGAGASESGGGGSFGAVGKAGVRDLGRAFTQAIPPACDSDPLWSKAALGSVGSITIAIEIEETGRIGGFKVLSEDPPKVLSNLARRTVAMLTAGTFSLKSGAVTGGRQTVEISAVTSDVDPPEGNTITLSQDFDGAVGKASFTQPNGRHVELKIKVVRVEVFAAAAP